MLDEMVFAGYIGNELGPYGFFPTDATVLEREPLPAKLEGVGSGCPVDLTDPASPGRAPTGRNSGQRYPPAYHHGVLSRASRTLADDP